ncbi:MAG: methyl-accepting chemotaxis protein [Planctomycetaceae bacterium]|nr:methyl-accepting chemotaxis protein [Planctomycetaceae bacterium]
MSLITKIFVAFAVVVAIAVACGIVGWQGVDRINDTQARVIEFEVVAAGDLRMAETVIQGMSVAQRTLLNSSLSMEERKEQLTVLQQQKDALAEVSAELADLFRRGGSVVNGWQTLNAEWNQVRNQLTAWNTIVDDGVAKLKAWEDTTILNPDGLLRDLNQYRGDHFQLAARLGEMIAKEEPDGSEVGSADNLCAFGRWRTRFEQGQEVFSQNENIRRALDIMTKPHRDFHQSAHDVYTLIADGYEENAETITTRYIEHLAAAREVIASFQMIIEEVDRARQLYTAADSFIMGETRESRAATMAALDHFTEETIKNMDANVLAAAAGRNGVRTMQGLATFALVLGLVVSIVLYITIRRQLTGPLTRVIAALASDANQVAGMAGDVATSSSSLSQGSADQSASLEETSAALEEITSMARKNLDNAQAANVSMQDNSKQIASSSEAVGRMSTAMSEIRDSSEKIGNILKTIEEIAFQTNLLALNAAVEAARAGEAGKGFAVVADEVRNLAQRSAQAVKDTAELITGTVDRVGNGVRITSEIESSFREIASTTEQITRMVEEIDVATGEQTQGLEQINQSVSQIDQVNQQNARHAEMNAQASVQLNDSSSSLMDQIDQLGGVLRIIVGRGAVNRTAIGTQNGNGNGNRRLGDGNGPVEVTARPAMRALPMPDDRF